VLPWDHIDTGITKAYLLRERAAARAEKATPDCRFGDCNECGVCDFRTVFPIIKASEEKAVERAPSTVPESAPKRFYRVRLRFSISGDSRFLSHLETVRVFSRAARRAGLPIRFSQGFHPQPKIAFGPALPVGVESRDEYVDMEFTKSISPSVVKDRLNRALPPGIEVFAGQEISLKTPAITDSLYETSYAVSCIGGPNFDSFSTRDLAAAVKKFLERRSVEHVRCRKGKKSVVDMRPAIAHISLADDRTLTMTIRAEKNRSVRPSEVLEALFELPQGAGSGLFFCKTRMELKEPWEQS
jgi:radical SAM-linked protein